MVAAEPNASGTKAMAREAHDNDPIWAAVRARLEAKRRETFEALRDYPRQVAGCDTHYRYLAEQRARISGELRQLDALRRAEPAEGIDAFVKSSLFVDDEALRAIRTELSG